MDKEMLDILKEIQKDAKDMKETIKDMNGNIKNLQIGQDIINLKIEGIEKKLDLSCRASGKINKNEK